MTASVSSHQGEGGVADGPVKGATDVTRPGSTAMAAAPSGT